MKLVTKDETITAITSQVTIYQLTEDQLLHFSTLNKTEKDEYLMGMPELSTESNIVSLGETTDIEFEWQ